jgi:hypothetical protein
MRNMKNPENCKISYLGFSKPESPKEIEFEILGLKNLIAKAQERISSLEQSVKLAQYLIEANKDVHFNSQEEKD